MYYIVPSYVFKQFCVLFKLLFNFLCIDYSMFSSITLCSQVPDISNWQRNCYKTFLIRFNITLSNFLLLISLTYSWNGILMCRVEKYNNSQLVYYYNRVIIVNSQLVYFFHILVYWIVSNKPVIYGDNIILTCKTGHVLTDSGGACGVRQWYSGQKHFLYNGVSKDARNMRIERTCHPRSFLLLLKTILSQISTITIHVHVVSSPTRNVLV